MSYVIICSTALLVSGLTLFSGFGLGTILMPAFAVFFPIEVAVAATAVVHGTNNIFKMIMVGRHADYGLVLRLSSAAFINPCTIWGLALPLVTFITWPTKNCSSLRTIFSGWARWRRKL